MVKLRARAAPALAVLALGVVGFPTAAAAADTDPSAASEDARRVVEEERTLMTVLGGWALGSVAAGAVMAADSNDSLRFAGLQNLAWGAVDGAIAAVALASLKTPADPQRERRKLSTIFAINAALDVVYVTAGILLTTLAEDERVAASGAAVIAQGGFLLAFDGIAAFLVRPR